MCDCNQKCETKVESINEVIARMMFDNNITMETLAKKSGLKVADITNILDNPDSIDSELLLVELLIHYIPYYVKVKEN